VRHFAILCYAFLLAALPLGGQVGGEDPYEMNFVQASLKTSLEVPGFSNGAVVKNLQRLGDGVSIALLKLLDEGAITDPEKVESFLPLIHHSFSYPAGISMAANKEPRVTLFLLKHLERDITEPGTKQHIRETIEFVNSQTAGLTRSKP
jgi:hypothetical protein